MDSNGAGAAAASDPEVGEREDGGGWAYGGERAAGRTVASAAGRELRVPAYPDEEGAGGAE